jgi:DNA-binding Lrp family transcriptional regulator
LDRKLLKILLSPNGDLKSSKGLSAKLGIPITTVRRRRKRLEADGLQDYVENAQIYKNNVTKTEKDP